MALTSKISKISLAGSFFNSENVPYPSLAKTISEKLASLTFVKFIFDFALLFFRPKMLYGLRKKGRRIPANYL